MAPHCLSEARPLVIFHFIREHKIGPIRQVDPSYPPFLTGWITILNPPKISNLQG